MSTGSAERARRETTGNCAPRTVDHLSDGRYARLAFLCAARRGHGVGARGLLQPDEEVNTELNR
jgi:hypothetical protein